MVIFDKVIKLSIIFYSVREMPESFWLLLPKGFSQYVVSIDTFFLDARESYK